MKIEKKFDKKNTKMLINICNKSLKFLVPSVFGIILCLKLTERPGKWLTDLVLNSNIDEKQTSPSPVKEDSDTRKKLVDELENFERNFFRNRDKPTKNCQRCDVCRAIAYRLDAEFEYAESQMGIVPIYNYDQGNMLSNNSFLLSWFKMFLR